MINQRNVEMPCHRGEADDMILRPQYSGSRGGNQTTGARLWDVHGAVDGPGTDNYLLKIASNS